MSLRFHLWFHFDFSLRFDFDFTSVSLWFHFDVTSVSLWFHLDSTSISFLFNFDVTSISLHREKGNIASQGKGQNPMGRKGKRDGVNPPFWPPISLGFHRAHARMHAQNETISRLDSPPQPPIYACIWVFLVCSLTPTPLRKRYVNGAP